MTEYYVKEYANFKCAAKDCPICCCGGGWNIYIDDITANFYDSIQGEDGEIIRNGIINKNGKKVFRLDGEGNCVFLNESGLCNIQLKYGESKLCTTCRDYPRSVFLVGDNRISYLTNSCPEVNRILFSLNSPLEFMCLSEDRETKEGMGLEDVQRAYITGLNLIQNRSISVSDRMFLLLFFVYQFQEAIKQGDDLNEIIDVFSSKDIYTSFLEELVKPRDSISSKIHTFTLIFESVMSRYSRYPMWAECQKFVERLTSNEDVKEIEELERAFERLKESDMQVEAENVLAYRFFATFMQGYKNVNYFEVIAYELIVYSALMTYTALSRIQYGDCPMENRIVFYSLCSRSDHSKSKEKLIELIRKDGYFEFEKLLSIIS